MKYLINSFLFHRYFKLIFLFFQFSIKYTLLHRIVGLCHHHLAFNKIIFSLLWCWPNISINPKQNNINGGMPSLSPSALTVSSVFFKLAHSWHPTFFSFTCMLHESRLGQYLYLLKEYCTDDKRQLLPTYCKQNSSSNAHNVSM